MVVPPQPLDPTRLPRISLCSTPLPCPGRCHPVFSQRHHLL